MLYPLSYGGMRMLRIILAHHKSANPIIVEDGPGVRWRPGGRIVPVMRVGYN